MVPESGQAFWGMPDIDMLNIIRRNIHSIGPEHSGGNDNCCTNKADTQSADTVQEANRTEKCYTSTDSILKSNNADKPMDKKRLSNTTYYFLPGPNCDSNKKMSAEITKQL